MLFLGHIAASLLIADAADADRTAAVAGNLLPDVVDKSGAVLHLQPSRWLAHGLPCYAVVCLAMRLVLDERRWRGFALGYAGHLLCDLWANSKVPWFAPFEKRRESKPRRKRSLRQKAWKWGVYLLPEFIGAPIVWKLLQPSSEGREHS